MIRRLIHGRYLDVTEIEFPFRITLKAREKITKFKDYWVTDGDAFKFRRKLTDKEIADIARYRSNS